VDARDATNEEPNSIFLATVVTNTFENKRDDCPFLLERSCQYEPVSNASVRTEETPHYVWGAELFTLEINHLLSVSEFNRYIPGRTMIGQLIRQCEDKDDCDSLRDVDPCDPKFGHYASREQCEAEGITVGLEGEVDRIPMSVLMSLAGVPSLDLWSRINADGTIEDTRVPSQEAIDSGDLRTLRESGLLLVLEIEYRK